MVENILNELKRMYPNASWAGPRCGSSLNALVATMLSAQCKDEYVDRITPMLFAKYPTAQAYAATDVEEIRNDIKSINHYKKKGERIKKACQIIVDKHNGLVPNVFDDLIALPGVGAKTANAVLRRMGRPHGYVVDTHVKRVAYRLGLTTTDKAEKVREELESTIPKEQWGLSGWRLILLGRNICHARKPQCNSCPLSGLCKKQGLE